MGGIRIEEFIKKEGEFSGYGVRKSKKYGIIAGGAFSLKLHVRNLFWQTPTTRRDDGTVRVLHALFSQLMSAVEFVQVNVEICYYYYYLENGNPH